MCLEQRLGSIDHRPHAETRDTRHRLCFNSVDAHRENAADRRYAPTEPDVCRRITELAAELLTTHDMAADRKRTSEQPRRRFEFTRGKMRTDGAAAGAFSADCDVGQDPS